MIELIFGLLHSMSMIYTRKLLPCNSRQSVSVIGRCHKCDFGRGILKGSLGSYLRPDAKVTNLWLTHLFVSCRRVQLSQSGFAIPTRVQLLPDPDLHPLLHAGHRQLGIVLARPERHSGSRLARRHHLADDGHPDLRHQLLAAACQLHKGHRRVDGRLFNFRLRRLARVRSGQLRLPKRRSPGRP